MRLTILASGSKGNMSLIEADGARLLLDVGVSYKRACEMLAAMGINPLTIDAVLLTHEHGDHAKGAPIFIDRFHPGVICTEGTAYKTRVDRVGDQFTVKGCSISMFPVPHDAADPIGFKIESKTGVLGIATDLGYVTPAIVKELADCDLVYLEASYEDALLAASKRPAPLIDRIRSSHGHLSNEQVAEAIHDIHHHNATTRFVVGHLSRECNSPEIVTKAVYDLNGPMDLTVHFDNALSIMP